MEISLYKTLFKIEKKIKKKPWRLFKNEKSEENSDEEENTVLGNIEEEIKILGEEFIKNNKNKGKLVIKNRKHPLKEFIDIRDVKEDKFKIYLIFSKDICNLSYIFENCKYLLSFSNLSEETYLDKIEVSNKNGSILNNKQDNERRSVCDNLYITKDFRESEISLNLEESDSIKFSLLSFRNNIIYLKNKFTNLRGMFLNCFSLTSLPDMSLWNTNDVKDMSQIFFNCKSLQYIPNISNWIINNVIDINRMFFNCFNLKLLPDISKWNTNNINNMLGLFYGCSSLKLLPDISKWNTDNVTDLAQIFSGCVSLLSLPNTAFHFSFKPLKSRL